MNRRFVGSLVASLFLTTAMCVHGKLGLAMIVLALAATTAALYGRAKLPPPSLVWYALVGIGVLAELGLILRELWSHYRYFGFPVAYLLDWSRQLQAARGLLGPLFLPGMLLPEVALLAGLTLSYTWRRMPLGGWRALMMICLYGHMAATLLYVAPKKPAIDVWYLQERACGLLMAGHNPYTAEYQAIAPLPPEIMHNGKFVAFPYPPLQVLADLPGYVWGQDLRWSLLVADLVAVWLTIACARRPGLPAGHPAELVALAFLFHPVGLMVLELSWTEPLVAFGAGMVAWCAASHRQSGLGAATGFLLASKQYAILLLPGFWASRRLRWRHTVIALILVLAVAVPFALPAPADFWRGVFTFHWYSPFRSDSMSVPAWLFNEWSFRLPAWLGLAITVLILAPALAWADGSVSHAVLCGALSLLAFFVFGKAAHLNYYWLVGYLLSQGAMVSAAESRPDLPPNAVTARETVSRAAGARPGDVMGGFKK
jgi:hypothetical protein